MSALGWTVLGGAIVIALPYAIVAVWNTWDWAVRRVKVRRLQRDGWTEPAMPAGWWVAENGAKCYGKTGIDWEPKRTVDITRYGKYTREIKRDVENSWIKGVEREKRMAARDGREVEK